MIWRIRLLVCSLAACCLLLNAARLSAASGPALAYHSPDTVTIWLPVLIRAVPVGEPFVIGESVAGRPLEVFRYGSGERKKLIVGGIHGGYEWNTTDLVRWMMDRVRDDPQMIPPEQTLYFLPVLNPDGAARSRWIQGRANDNNADINRNFDANWKSSWYRTGCWNYLPITAGRYPFSEPEAAALRDFVLREKVEAMISYHSSGAELYAGGVPPDPASLDLTLTLEQASGYAYPPHASPCEMTGQMIDWASAQGIAAVDVELAYHQSIDYPPNERILAAFLQWSPPQD